jgi:hypothetical protein
VKRIHARMVVAIAIVAMLSTPAPTGAVAGFGDVWKGAYYAAPVQWMVDNDITTGTGPCSFAPEDPITRGQAAAFIWRMEGRQNPISAHPFRDVFQSWQQEPISWLYSRGITTGTSSIHYSPDAPVTRGDFAVLLHRLAGSPAVPVNYSFTDVVLDYQKMAIAWMAQRGITTGTTPTTL